MDNDKMSCRQEVGMSSGEAPMPSLHDIESAEKGEAIGNFSIESLHDIEPPRAAIGNFSMESRDLPLEFADIEPVGEAIGNFTMESRDLPLEFAVEESRSEIPASQKKRLHASCVLADVKVSCCALPASCAERDVKVSCCALCIFKKQSVRKFKTQSVGDFKTQWATTPVSSPVSLPVFLPTIYKVPQRIRQANKDEYDPYEPQTVSIGPYHHLKKKEFEKHKERYQQSILFRNPKHVLEDYHTAIAKLEFEARSCYSEHVGLDCNEFVEMMVLDGCFIVELFLRNKEKKFKEDPIFSRLWMLPLIRYDMLLLENQIPFFVLEIIYKMASLGNGSLVELALDFFERIVENKIKVPEDLINGHYFHLLHLFHSYLMPTPREKSKKCKILMCLEAKLPIKNTTIKNIRDTTIKMIPCAAELKLAGVKFKKKKDFSSFLDVKFSGGVLEIPPLCIDDYANPLLRNLVAFEQFCYPGVKTIHFTNYVVFMDCIVNTSKDVALLHRNGIIDHLLGSDGHVADLFNQLRYGIFNDYEDYNYLSGIYKDVDKYYNTPWNTCWARLRSDYFTNPWAGFSTAAAVLLILLTILQTIYIILSYYRPGS